MSGSQAVLASIVAMDAEERTSVLIVGGGLVGLSMSAFLSWHRVRCTVVERHAGISPHPRARGINPRTMELLRLLDLEDRVRATESARALAGNTGIIAVETLAGREFGSLEQSYFRGVEAPEELSPAGWCMCHQDELEPLIRDRAASLGGTVRFGHELEGFTQDEDGVTATVRDRSTGARTEVRADHLVAADGAAGRVREALGIGTHGPGTLAHFMNIAFEADLTPYLRGRRFIMCYTTGTGTRSALLPVNNADRWMLHVMCGPDETASFTEARCAELVRGAVGDERLDVRITGALPWESAGRVADRFQDGRVFLVGDAAHVMPPSGAFGANVGIQDAHNLAWRLAMVAHGDADAALTAGYDAERRPVADHTMLQAVLRSKDRPRLSGTEAPPPDPRIVPDEVVIFGQRQPAPRDAGIDGDGDTVNAGDGDAFWADRPDGTPGTRAPHVRLGSGDRPRSTIDLYRHRFTLVTGPAGGPWQGAAERVPAALGSRLQVHIVGAGTEDADTGDAGDAAEAGEAGRRWCAAHGVTPTGAVLVRPDGFVAWRATVMPADPAAELAAAMAAVLAGGAPAPEPARGPGPVHEPTPTPTPEGTSV